MLGRGPGLFVLLAAELVQQALLSLGCRLIVRELLSNPRPHESASFLRRQCEEALEVSLLLSLMARSI